MIRLSIGTEQHYDRSWGCERTYYFVQDDDGQRYSEIEPLPEWAWNNVWAVPLWDHGPSLDNEVRFS